MKVLMISIDASVLDEASPSFARMREYAQYADELHVIVLKRGRGIVDRNNLHIYAAPNFLTARLLAEEIITTRSIDWVSAQDPFITGFLGRLLKNKYDVKLELQFHGDFFSPYFRKESLKHRFFWQLLRSTVPAADRYRAVSERIKKGLIVFGASAEKIMVAPIAVDIGYFSERVSGEDLHQTYDADFLFCFAGNLVPVKNVPLLLQAFTLIKNYYPKTKLLIAGDGPLRRQLFNQVRSLRLEANVVFLGAVTNMRSLLQQADAFVLPSWYEGYGRVVVEAMAAGAPVVMSDVGLATEIIINNQNGLIIPPGRLDLLVETMLELRRDEALRARLSKAARQTAAALPNKEEITKKLFSY